MAGYEEYTIIYLQFTTTHSCKRNTKPIEIFTVLKRMKKEIIATDRNNEEGELAGESEVDLKARILAYTQNMSTNKYCVVYCTVCETIA